MSRKGFAAALLLAALSARAQVEVRPAVVLPSAPGAFALAPASILMPAPALTLAPLAALTAPPILPPAASAMAATPAAAVPATAAPLPPVEAHAAAMSGALAEFERTDLKTAAAGESREAGESLMLRVLGADIPAPAAVTVERPAVVAAPPAAPRPSARRAEPKVYLLSKPLRETVKLGPLAIVLHVVLSSVWEVVKDATLFIGVHRATGSIAAAAAATVFEAATSSGMFTARTLGDLGQRYWRRKLAVLKELAQTPEVERVRVLTSGPVVFSGILARSKDNTGLIFVEADGDLPESLGRFGAPIPLGDAAANQVRLAFVQDGKASAVVWTPTLKDLFDARPIPPSTAAAWRADAEAAKTDWKKARVEGTLISPDGSERSLDSVVDGGDARKLIGLSFRDRARAFLGWGRPRRAIAISDSRVERPEDARATGIFGALRRAWLRLRGRLIVAKE
jgi:hypothetical protein